MRDHSGKVGKWVTSVESRDAEQKASAWMKKGFQWERCPGKRNRCLHSASYPLFLSSSYERLHRALITTKSFMDLVEWKWPWFRAVGMSVGDVCPNVFPLQISGSIWKQWATEKSCRNSFENGVFSGNAEYRPFTLSLAKCCGYANKTILSVGKLADREEDNKPGSFAKTAFWEELQPSQMQTWARELLIWQPLWRHFCSSSPQSSHVLRSQMLRPNWLIRKKVLLGKRYPVT